MTDIVCTEDILNKKENQTYQSHFVSKLIDPNSIKIYAA